MTAAHFSTPLLQKIGLSFQDVVRLINPPANYFELLNVNPIQVNFVKSDIEIADFIHFFVKDQAELIEKVPELVKHFAKDGQLWISWPKKASLVPTDVTESLVRSTGLATGLVDVKVAAIDETWSGLKFVHRVEDRR